MKKLKILTACLCIVFAIIIFAISCKKEKSGCPVTGGLHQYPRYIFYISKDFGCGYITVTIKNSKGNSVPLEDYQNTIKVVDHILPEKNCYGISTHDNQRAYADLEPGYIYTYTAACQNKTWTGTIEINCGKHELCNYIELK